ncbi:MAG TPA: Ig-like domain-containing protein, partial [Longimicrobium sp.]|nr:Ig-like domain-containing protein [Longimicrobium sp.]
MRRLLLSACALALLAGTACEDPVGKEKPGPPAGVEVVSGNGQTAAAGQAAADSLAVRVTDERGNPVPGAAVVWSVRSGGGSIAPLTTTTGADGVARAAWTLGTRVDSVQVAQAAAGVSLVTEFTAQATLPLGAQVIKVSGDAQTAAVGTQLPAPLKVAVRLMDGRPVVGAAVTWSTGSGTIAGTSPTDANGEATAAWTLGTTSGGQVATAASPGAAAAAFTATVLPGAPASLLKVAGDNATAPVGTQLTPVARVVDAHGNGVPGVAVLWFGASAGGTAAPQNTATNAAGDASTTWTLGMGTGSQRLDAVSGNLPGVRFTATATAATGSSGNVGITVRLPLPNTAVGDLMTVAARITTPGSGITMTAQVMDRTANLVFSVNEFSGTLDLSGLPRGELTLRVRAQAANGDTGVVNVPIIHDNPPRLTVAAPVFNTVARPELRIDADCTDDDPAGCTSVVVDVMNFATPSGRLASGTTGVHTTVSLAAFERTRMNLRIRAIDNRGQATDVFREVHVWTNPQWSEVATGGMLMGDVDASRALTLDSAAVRILSTGTSAQVAAAPRPDGSAIGLLNEQWRAFLHPAGAIFVLNQVYDLRAGGLVPHGGDVSSLDAEGGWAAWNRGFGGRTLMLEDLVGGTVTEISTSAHPTGGNVAANGDLVWSEMVSSDGGFTFRYTIFRWRNGTRQQVSPTPGTSGGYLLPVTDGINVAYVRITNQSGGSDLLLWDGTSETLLAAGHNGALFRLAGGWAAYHVFDLNAVRQVWV